MAIHRPGRSLLRDVPLSFVANKVAGGKSKPLDAAIPLVPFIDFLITLVVFLLTTFGANGDFRANVHIPTARNTHDLELAPIIAIDARDVTLDGRRVAGTADLEASPQMDRVPLLVADLETLHQNWQQLHPGHDFRGDVIIQADERVDYRVLKKTLFS